MKAIQDYTISPDQAVLQFLGQAGFLIHSCGQTIVIDPYLSDSVAKVSPGLTRLTPPPILPSQLNADIYIVTHDHLDHLDPETLKGYCYVETTTFVAPRLACDTLRRLGIPEKNIIQIDSGQRNILKGIEINGIYAVASEPSVIDTTGYLLKFPNGRSVYHSSDTSYSELLLQCAPRAEVALVCINGQWGNLNIEQAAQLVNGVKPRYAIPHHYDVMALNAKNPETFKYQMNYVNPEVEVVILSQLETFIW